MTLLDTAQPRTAVRDYRTLRTTVGVYRVDAPLVRITGDDRLAVLDQFLSKASDFVEPETVRECLVLGADGAPFAIMLHLELGDETWLLPRTRVSAEALRGYFAGLDVPADVTVEVAPEGWGATAFEGPQAWSVAAHFVDFDISGLTLHAITPVTVPGTDEPATAHLARVGTTGEYGYLLFSEAPEAGHDAVLSAASAVGGSAVGPQGLARVQAEAGMAVYEHGLSDLSVNDADLAWMISWDRIGDFHGSADLVPPTIESAKLTALAAAAGTGFTAGTPITAGDVQVGTIAGQTPSANPDEELVLAVLDAPFWVPGLDLRAQAADGTDQPLRTVTLPRVLALSSHTRIG
jgi:glycine cleavage system aminomethyltransferase T